MKLKTNHFTCALVALFALLTASCCTEGVSPVGIRTDALDDAAWDSSVWISAADADVVTGKISGKNFLAADGASWFWSSVTNDNEVVSAKWMTAGLGVYDVYVNGQLVGLEILKPGFTHNAKTKYSFTYDITDAISKSRGAVNEFSAQVTPGWWGDKIVTPNGNEGMIGHKCAFRGVLEVVYADGTTKRYGTDLENWKAGIAGPVQHAAIFDGEFHDAREPMGYDVPEKLSVPEINNEFQGNIYPSAGAEIYLRPELAFSPVEAYVWEGVENAGEDAYGKIIVKREYESGDKMQVLPGETLVIDFGQNAAAVPEFVFKAEEGTVLTCLPAELLNDGNGAKSRGMDGPEGSCHRLNLRTPEDGMILEYTFADRNGYVRYSPRCTFYGYRYVSITATAPVTIKSVVSVPVTSIKAEHETGRITTGNELVNKLISNTVWGMNSNYLSV
ncbi:MAG: family 78 glycoside hydrolase catalytic domain, partial [Bacteroidales bacterium]|nr:family 78 glycoside hydrolase catalytic domain [Bacteroidales bacterium]